MQISNDTKRAEIAEKQAHYDTQKAEFLQEYQRLQQIEGDILRQRKTISALESQIDELRGQARGVIGAETFTQLKAQQREAEQQKADCVQYLEACELKKQHLLVYLSSKKQLVQRLHSELTETYGNALISQALEQNLADFVNGIFAVCESRDFLEQVHYQANATNQDVNPQSVVIKSIVERLERALTLAEAPNDKFLTQIKLPYGEFANIPFISPMKARQLTQEQRHTD